MHIHAHTVSDLSPFCVQFTASQWKPKSGDPFFGVVVFTFPQKTSTGPPFRNVRQRHVSGLRFSPLTMHRPLCHSVPFSWSHAWRSKWKNGRVFLRHSEARISRIFLVGSQKISNWCQEKKTKKVYVYILYIYLYMWVLLHCLQDIKDYVYIIYIIFI